MSALFLQSGNSVGSWQCEKYVFVCFFAFCFSSERTKEAGEGLFSDKAGMCMTCAFICHDIHKMSRCT